MSKATKLYNLLPEGYLGKKIVLEHFQTVPDIMHNMEIFHKKYMYDYDYISLEFYTGNLKNDLDNLWEFCRYNITYKIETTHNQRLQSPAAILYNKIGDCKTMALFCGGVIDSWERLGLYKLSTLHFMFACYDKSKIPGHVFVECNGFWVDPVLDSFDNRKKPTFIKKINLMLYGISGVKPTIKTRIGDDEDNPQDLPPEEQLPEGVDSINSDGSIDYSNGYTLGADGILYDENDNILGEGVQDYDPINGNTDYENGTTLESDGTLYDSENNIIGEGVDSYNPVTNTTDYNNGVTLEGDGILYGANDEILSTGVEDYNPLTGNIDYTDGYTVTGDHTLYDDKGDVVATDVIAYNPETGVVTYDGGNTETLDEIEKGGNKPGTPQYTPHNNSNGQPGRPPAAGSGSSGTGTSAGGGSTGITWPPKGAPQPAHPASVPVKHTSTPTKQATISPSGLFSGNMPLILLGAGVLYLLTKK